MSDSHSNAYQKLSDMPLEHQSDFDWNRCPICFRTGVRHELESLSDLACSTHPARAMELAAQTGNDLVSESRFGATVAHSRKRPALPNELLNRLVYLVEMRMRFNGHGGESVPSHRTLFKDFRCFAEEYLARDSSAKS